MSPFPCSLPDLAPISASVLQRTAGTRVLVHVQVQRDPHPEQKNKTIHNSEKAEYESMTRDTDADCFVTATRHFHINGNRQTHTRKL